MVPEWVLMEGRMAPKAVTGVTGQLGHGNYYCVRLVACVRGTRPLLAGMNIFAGETMSVYSYTER